MERLARWIVFVLLLGVGLLTFGGIWLNDSDLQGEVVELRGKLPESGGWGPEVIRAEVGEPLRLRMTSDDVVHSFAIGQSDFKPVDVMPGEWTTVDLLFDRPGRYVFYCTRWCGENHWRMRGTIEVSGLEETESPSEPPLYVRLGLDLDAPHSADVVPDVVPLAQRGAQWADLMPAYALDAMTYWGYSPAQLWSRLRDEPALAALSDADVWHAIAWTWANQVDQNAMLTGQTLYARDCAACHGETGAGDGVMVRDLPPFSNEHGHFGQHAIRPPDFGDPALALGASPALLQGKILRGGMGTGMPYWGPIYTPEEVEALVSYLYTFVFDLTP